MSLRLSSLESGVFIHHTLMAPPTLKLLGAAWNKGFFALTSFVAAFAGAFFTIFLVGYKNAHYKKFIKLFYKFM